MTQAPRLPDGTFEHSCTENRYPLQVWADTLFMGGIFLAKWGLKSGDPPVCRGGGPAVCQPLSVSS